MIISKKIEWFALNYKNSYQECYDILLKAERESPLTVEKIKEGCIELKKAPFMENDLRVHVKALSNLSFFGIEAGKSGKLLRETILKIKQNIMTTEFKRGEVVQVRDDDSKLWNYLEFYGTCGDFYLTKYDHEEEPIVWKFIQKKPDELAVKVTMNGKEIDPSDLSKKSWEALRTSNK